LNSISNIIRASFPAAHRQEAESISVVIAKHCEREREVFSGNEIKCQLNGEALKFPYRFYCPEPKQFDSMDLVSVERAMLLCLYTRHHNGRVREKALQQIINSEFRFDFVIPFLIQLIAEYIVQILVIIENNLHEDLLKRFAIFAVENPIYWEKTQARYVSYWNEYYRWNAMPRNEYKTLKKYPGFIIATKVNATIRRMTA